MNEVTNPSGVFLFKEPITLTSSRKRKTKKTRKIGRVGFFRQGVCSTPGKKGFAGRSGRCGFPDSCEDAVLEEGESDAGVERQQRQRQHRAQQRRLQEDQGEDQLQGEARAQAVSGEKLQPSLL